MGMTDEEIRASIWRMQAVAEAQPYTPAEYDALVEDPGHADVTRLLRTVQTANYCTALVLQAMVGQRIHAVRVVEALWIERAVEAAGFSKDDFVIALEGEQPQSAQKGMVA
jgi:hypothetical protein